MVLSNRLVLVIGLDRVVSMNVATQLTASGYLATQIADAGDAEHAMASSDAEFDAIVLDVDGMTGDGIETCVKFRHHFRDIIIILMSGTDDEALLVRGLHAGADDFIRKPFWRSELIPRLQARLRDLGRKPNATVTLGHLSFFPDKRLLVDNKNNVRIHLPTKEAKLLWHLYIGNGHVVSRTDLLHAVWSYNHMVSSHTVQTHVYRLRQKVEANPARPSMIITERGGYRLAMPKAVSLAALTFPLRPFVSAFLA